jgi:hypothetical protein
VNREPRIRYNIEVIFRVEQCNSFRLSALFHAASGVAELELGGDNRRGKMMSKVK